MKKIFLVFLFLLLLSGCQSIEELADQRAYEESKISSVLGEDSGPLHVIGFFSLSSKESQNVPMLVEKMQNKFGNVVLMEYRRSWENRASLLADEATECAREQGKIREFLDEYFNNYFEDYDRDTMLEIALRENLDMEMFEACLDSGSMQERIFRDKAMAKKYDIEEIPSFVVERSITISQSLDEETFAKAIQSLLETLK